MIEEHSFEYDIIEEEDGFTLSVESIPWRGLADELAELHYLHGAQFIRQLKLITEYGDFHPVEGETNIFSTGGEKNEDYPNLLDAARKAVEHGYQVYILPNPKGFRTADFIFERKGVFKMFDLKTITGRASADNRLRESIGQTNRILLNMACNYNPRLLSLAIKHYFEQNQDAVEVLIFKGNKTISVNREETEAYAFIRNFMMKY